MTRRLLPIPGRTASVPFGGKIGPVSTDRNVAQVTSAPSPVNGRGENRTQAFTYFTKPTNPGDTTPILYNGDRPWVKVKVLLETAGPVSIGQSSQLLPVLSGKGELLRTDVEREFTIAKGTRLYIQCTSVNRVAVTIEPLPWLEQITGLIIEVSGRLMSALKK